MKVEDLRAIQAPLKERYREEPDAARITLTAQGKVGEGVTSKVQTGRALVEAGLHPLTGGDGLSLCSGGMLLEALVACAGVTLSSVAAALGIELRDATVRAEGELDFRGTLAVSEETPIGFQQTRLAFDLDIDASRRRSTSARAVWLEQAPPSEICYPTCEDMWYTCARCVLAHDAGHDHPCFVRRYDSVRSLSILRRRLPC